MVTPTNADFEIGPLKDFERTIVRTPVTVAVSNTTGEKSYSNGSTSELTGVFINPKDKYFYGKDGLLKQRPAKFYFKGDVTVSIYDILTIESNDFRVSTISSRYFKGNLIFKRVEAFLI